MKTYKEFRSGGWFTRLLERGGVFERRRGNLLILSRHKILDQVALDILNGLSDDFSLPQKTIVYIGTHKPFGWDYFRRGFKIGVQTEHFQDENAKPLVRFGIKFRKTVKSYARFDAILEMYTNNKPLYDTLPEEIRAKTTFGPFIFPTKAPEYSPEGDGKVIFFGTLASEHRKNCVSRIPPEKLTVLTEVLFGNDLLEEITKHSAVLNLHFIEGVYTEYPRLVTALYAGKPVVSEELSSDLRPGVHYVLLEDLDKTHDPKAIFENFAAKVTTEYSFEGYIQSLFDGLPKNQ